MEESEKKHDYEHTHVIAWENAEWEEGIEERQSAELRYRHVVSTSPEFTRQLQSVLALDLRN